MKNHLSPGTNKEPAWRQVLSRGALLLLGLLLLAAGVAIFFAEAISDTIVATSVGVVVVCIGIFMVVWGLLPASRHETVAARFGAIIDKL